MVSTDEDGIAEEEVERDFWNRVVPANGGESEKIVTPSVSKALITIA